MLTMKDFDYYNSGVGASVFDEYEDQYERRQRELRRTKKLVKEEIGDDAVEYNGWTVFDN